MRYVAPSDAFPPSAIRPARLVQAGFTLFEVLVAILVLSFGMLGVVGLQASALQANKEARNQSAAVRLGREYAEMMRANRGIAMVDGNVYLNPSVVGLPPAGACVTASCTPAAYASYEIGQWYDRLQGELPGARVVVCFDTKPYETTGASKGLPIWNCVKPGSITREVPPLFVKIGWAQQSLNRAADGTTGKPMVILPTDAAARPQVVVPAQLN